MTVDWAKEITIAHLVKQKVSEMDTAGLWEHPFPEVAATCEEISSAEGKLGHPFDSCLRKFLQHSNGWNSFFHSIDVFGVDDFLKGTRRDRSLELLSTLENLREICGFEFSDLVPFAVSMDDIDVFAISKSINGESGKVFWFAGGLVDKFEDFDEWFLSMVDYNRSQYEKLKKSIISD